MSVQDQLAPYLNRFLFLLNFNEQVKLDITYKDGKIMVNLNHDMSIVKEAQKHHDADNMILMKEHIREVHEYPCPLNVDKIMLLKGHMRKVHEYQCHLCEGTFKDQDHLNLHVYLRHTSHKD